MIIDLILDRKDYIKIDKVDTYDPKTFYHDVMQYGETGFGITRAMDTGSEKDIKRELYQYIVDQDYNPDIKKFIDSVEWLPKK